MEIDSDKVISKYAIDLQLTYKNFSAVVKELLVSILKTNQIIPHSITNREKSPSSLKGKILRDTKNYNDPLSEITDLAGVRVITYFTEDVDKIVPLIEKEFKIDRINSVDKRKKSDPSSFGYLSVHLVVELSDNRSSLPEYVSYIGLKCEIQVRTILQHAWAEIEHDIVYKSNDEIPFELRHRFASLAGLLEVADREFEQLRKEEIKVREKIEETISNDNFDLPINRDSLIFYFEKIRKEEALFIPEEDSVNNDSTSEDLPINRRIGEFLKLLNDQKISTIQELHKILSSNVMDEAIIESEKIECPNQQKCLIKYFIAISISKNIERQKIAEYARCPIISDKYPFSYEEDKKEKRRDKKNAT